MIIFIKNKIFFNQNKGRGGVCVPTDNYIYHKGNIYSNWSNFLLAMIVLSNKIS